ncbi:MAG TPA: hypothetical protein VEJ46_11735 [Candidatus Acidoferrum sp.]|nr:hypothetical protein [Candidatus Acidoferrum sp.]
MPRLAGGAADGLGEALDVGALGVDFRRVGHDKIPGPTKVGVVLTTHLVASSAMNGGATRAVRPMGSIASRVSEAPAAVSSESQSLMLRGPGASVEAGGDRQPSPA